MRSYGVHDIHEHPGFYENHRDRLQAADLAYFTHNASLDDGPIGDDDFHNDFHSFREGTPNADIRKIIKLRLLRATFDHAAKMDHITGGSTLVVHIPGALEPLTPALPEFISANVYVPGTLRREFKREGREEPIPDIVQLLIKELGVSTVERFDRARSRRWPYPRNMDATRPRPLPILHGVPEAIPKGSSRYTFYGQRDDTPDPVMYFAPVGAWNGFMDAERSRGTRPGASFEPMADTTLDSVD